MKTLFLFLLSFLFLSFSFDQGTTNYWNIFKSIQMNIIPDATTVLGSRIEPIKNKAVDDIDGTFITLKGYYHNAPGSPAISQRILFSQHDNWNMGCGVNQPTNYTLELVRTANLRVYYHRLCTIRGKLKMNWTNSAQPLSQLTEVTCLMCQ